MAKNWTIKEGIMTRTYADDTFDLILDLQYLFPDWATLDDAQQGTVVNGVKQKVDDSIARTKAEKLTEAEKRTIQAEVWRRLTEDRKWNAEAGERNTAVKQAKALDAEGELTPDQRAILVKIGLLK